MKRQQKFITTRQVKNFSEEAFLSELRSIDWQFLLEYSIDVKEDAQSFSSVLSAKIEKFAQ